MARFEYKVVPAPKKGAKSWGLRSTEDRFATALSKIMNDLAAEGWEYQRSDTLPCEEKSGFRGKSTVFQNMLVFRREVVAAATVMPEVAASPEPKLSHSAPVIESKPEPVLSREPAPAEERAPEVVLPVFMRGERDKKPDLAAE